MTDETPTVRLPLTVAPNLPAILEALTDLHTRLGVMRLGYVTDQAEAIRLAVDSVAVLLDSSVAFIDEIGDLRDAVDDVLGESS